MKNGPLVIIDDNQDEIRLYKIAFQKLKVNNKILDFSNGREALHFLETTPEDPFLIICDINMPVMDGLELRERIHANSYLRKKATPFVFRTGSATRQQLHLAYALTVQGFFNKTNDFKKLEKQLEVIISYWQSSLGPGDMD